MCLNIFLYMYEYVYSRFYIYIYISETLKRPHYGQRNLKLFIGFLIIQQFYLLTNTELLCLVSSLPSLYFQILVLSSGIFQCLNLMMIISCLTNAIVITLISNHVKYVLFNSPQQMLFYCPSFSKQSTIDVGFLSVI